MLTIFVLFVGLTLATAVIAYWSDNLGKKLGKKRVSLWGLRPRTTATFLTIASSWGIMVFTLAVMLVIFPPLRRALLRFDEVAAKESRLRVSKNQLDGEVGTLKSQLASLQNQTGALQNDVAVASQKLGAVRGQLSQSRAAFNTARAARDNARNDAQAARQNAQKALGREQAAARRETEARDNLGKVSAQRDSTQKQRDAAQRQLSRARNELESASAEVKSAQAQVKSADARVAAANKQVAQAERELTSAQTNEVVARKNEAVSRRSAATAEERAKIANERAKIANERAKIANERAKIANVSRRKADADSLAIEGEVLRAQALVTELRAKSDELSRANDDLLRVNQNVVGQNETILLSDVRVPVGRTLVEQKFEQGTSVSGASEGLRALFERASSEGAVRDLLPGARLELLPLPDQGGQSLLSADEIYDRLAQAIARSQTPLSVRLIAARNHLAGDDQLVAQFIALAVRPALPAGFELASARLDPGLGDARLFTALLNLADAGSQVAARNGVKPPLSPDAPDFYAPGSTEQIFRTLRQISARNGVARVRIVTTQAISTAEPLSVRFEVEPATSAPPTAASAAASAAASTTASARLAPAR